jgi:carotenoid cleavage dioxygenase-like enzyme
MIDELVKYIATRPDIDAEVLMHGEEVRRANRIKVSNAFNGYADFLATKVPAIITTNPAQNAWNKRREPTHLDYTNDNFPPMDMSKKARFLTDDTNTMANLSEPLDTVIVDLETELAKEWEITDDRLNAFQKIMTAELEEMKQEFHAQLQKSIEESEGRMTSVIKQHIGELMSKSEDAIA